MFGLSLEKLILVMVIAAVLIGPTRLPAYARRLADFIRAARAQMDAATVRLEQDTGLSRDQWNPEEWRRYDPREIVRSALRDSPAEAAPSRSIDVAATGTRIDAAAPDRSLDEAPTSSASDVPTSDGPWAEVLAAPETLARIRPGQRFIVVGNSAHPTRVAIASLPEQHPARRAAAVVDTAEDTPTENSTTENSTTENSTTPDVSTREPHETAQKTPVWGVAA